MHETVRLAGSRHPLLTALGLSIGAAVALGFSRFAYALLLPPMRDALDLTYVEAGGLNTANAAGYILGVAASGWAAKHFGIVRTFAVGLSVSAGILLLSATASSFAILITLRTVGGVSTAFAFILGAALAGAIDPIPRSSRSAFLVSIYVAGSSLGIVISGVTAPLALADGASGWRWGWAILGVLAMIGLAPAYLAARAVPVPAKRSAAILDAHELRQIAPTILAYGLFGARYVGYMTFIIALLRAQGGSNNEATAFWIALGVISMIATPLWGRVLGQMPAGRGPAVVFALAAFGALPVLLHPGIAAAFLSAVVFGGSFMAGPASIAIVAQRQLPPASLTAAIAILTIAFALGQAIGPLIAGALTDLSGDVAAGLWASPLLLAAAAGAALLQRAMGDRQSTSATSAQR
jgi:predicted MFS family arabinose efflux permease